MISSSKRRCIVTMVHAFWSIVVLVLLQVSHGQLEIQQNNGEYTYADDVPLVQVFRRAVPKTVYDLLRQFIEALADDRASDTGDGQLKHGKVRCKFVHAVDCATVSLVVALRT